MVRIVYPESIKHNPAFWLNPSTWWSSRQKFLRRDNSNAWRKSYLGTSLGRHPDRSLAFSEVLRDPAAVSRRFRIVVLGDTGEGDWSQYGLVPLIRALDPHLMVINGDVAYPAGSEIDFRNGFFRPYRNLPFPIWAVPGNHEYYSRDKGRTFYQVFCTDRYAGWWSEFGLRLVPQPGTYWELKEPDGGPPFALIGLDTGMQGDLDGGRRGGKEDREQHEWLRSRLRRCEQEGRAVVVLFHIPALVDDEPARVGLRRVHEIIGQSPAVRLVLCGHIHNHQCYSAKTFRRYLETEQRVSPTQPNGFPRFVVSGGGGAYLSEPKRRPEGYPADWVYPDQGQWRRHIRALQWTVSKVGLTKWAVGRIAGRFAAVQRGDRDAASFLSLSVMDVDTQDRKVEVRHVLMDDVDRLFAHLPKTTLVRVDDPKPPVDPQAVEAILAKHPPIVF